MAPYLIYKFSREQNAGQQEEILQNIDQHITYGRLDVLLGLCSGCAYQIFDERLLISECTGCTVHQGITEIIDKRIMMANITGSA